MPLRINFGFADAIDVELEEGHEPPMSQTEVCYGSYYAVSFYHTFIII